MTHHRSVTAASLLACLLILCAGVALAWDGDDGEPVLHEHHEIRLKLDDDMEAIEIDDLQPGESRQFFTDEGKEIVVTRGDDGVEITVDGEEIASPRMIHLDTLTEEIGGDTSGVHKVVVRTGHRDGGSAVWINSDESGESHIEIEHLGDEGHRMHWISGEGADVEIHRRSAADFLQEKGVLDGLADSDRQAILDALKEFDSERMERRVVFVGEDD